MSHTSQRQSSSNRREPVLPIRSTDNQEATRPVTCNQEGVQDSVNHIQHKSTTPEDTLIETEDCYPDISETLDSFQIKPGAPWGFVVFRTVYGADSNEPWARMLQCLRSSIEESLSYATQNDLSLRHELTVIENVETLAGANSHTVRQAFREWVADDATSRILRPEEWGGIAQIRLKLRSNDSHGSNHPVNILPPRWKFCLFVDEMCLRSLDPSVGRGEPVVKMLRTDFHDDRVGVVAEGWEDGETDDPLEDVGWMYMDVEEYVTRYDHLANAVDFEDYYERPYEGYLENRWGDGGSLEALHKLDQASGKVEQDDLERALTTDKDWWALYSHARERSL